jgi:hypothetical protein
VVVEVWVRDYPIQLRPYFWVVSGPICTSR